MCKIYILLPVHNRKAITRRFVDCLKSQTNQDFHLVLIDDGSTDQTEEMVREDISNVTVLRGTGDWWWGGSLQKGLDWLRANVSDQNAIVLMINDDVTFSPEYLEKARSILRSAHGALVLSRLSEEGEVKESGVEADWRKLTFKIAASPDKINCLSTRGLFVKWGDLSVIGDFHPRILPHYLSDYEFTMRAKRKGLSLQTSPELLIVADDAETGYHKFNGLSFFKFMRHYFSKKSALNPFYWTSFVVLTAPLQWILPNVARVWCRAGLSLVRQISGKSA